MASPVLPPVDGSLPTIIHYLDFNSVHNADWPYAIFPSPEDATKLSSISFAEMAQASHHAAHLLRPGRQGTDGEVVVLLLSTDSVVSLLVILGLMRAGLVVRFTSMCRLNLTPIRTLGVRNVAT